MGAAESWQLRRVMVLCQELLTAVPAADGAGRESRALALYYYGEASRRLGELPGAIELFAQCVAVAGGDGRFAVQGLERWAHTLAQSGEIAAAKVKLQEAALLAEKQGDLFCRAVVVQQQGNLAWFEDHLDEALGFYQRALDMYEELRDLPSQLNVWINIGLTQHYIGRLDKAIEGYEEGLKLARYLKHPAVGMLLSNLGECYQDLLAMAQARTYHEQAITAVHSLPLETDNLPSTLADIHRNLGVDLYYLGDIEGGRSQLQKALALLREEDDLDIRLQTLYTLALVELEQGQLEDAWEHIQKSLALAQQYEMRVHVARTMYLMGLYHQQNGDVVAAQAAWQQSLFLTHETGQRLVLWQGHVALGDVADNPALAMVHYQIAAEIIHQVTAPIADEALRRQFLDAPQVKRVLTAVQKR